MALPISFSDSEVCGPSMQFETFEWLTFDCYGTLIDWESGILSAMRAILDSHDRRVPDDEILTLFGEVESRVETGEYRPYRDVLAGVVSGFGAALGFEPTQEQVSALALSVGDWPIFPDTVAALTALKTRYKLAVISNVDDDLFAGSCRRLGVQLDEVVTAERVGSYKPSLANFRFAFDRLGLGPDGILHVAQSLYHDIAPARELGLACVWVNRRALRKGPGATASATADPDLEVPDLESLVMLMGLGG